MSNCRSGGSPGNSLFGSVHSNGRRGCLPDRRQRRATAMTSTAHEFVERGQVVLGCWHLEGALRAASATCSYLSSVPAPADLQAASTISTSVAKTAAAVLRAARPLGEMPGCSAGSRRSSSTHVCAFLCALLQEFRSPSTNVSTLATSVGVTRGRLSHLVRQMTGFSPHVHLSVWRLLDAVVRLTDEQTLIKVVAVESGFSGTSELDHQFSRWMHLPPTRFREVLQRDVLTG